jgi:hypothetical protein
VAAALYAETVIKKPVLAALVLTIVFLLTTTAAASARTFDKAFFGPGQSFATAFPLYQDLGVQVAQMELRWNEVAASRPADPTNPADPAYHWPTGMDQILTSAQASGIQMLLIVMETPSWANGGQQDPAWAPTDPQDYANFMTAASKRYPTVKRWMIWGEPCRVGNFKPITYQPYGHALTRTQRSEVRRYAVILDDAYAALKSADPANVVIGGNTWSVCDIRPLDWVKFMRLPNGRPPRMDLYGHNPIGLIKRQKPLPASWHVVELEDLPRLQSYIDRYLGPGSPHRIGIWLSEYFLPTTGNPKTNFVVKPSQQAPILKAALRIARRTPTVTGFGYDYLFDAARNGNAGLITADGVKKPSYYAFRNG